MEPVHTEQIESEAEYQLEAAARCPACRDSIDAVHIVRLLRTKVNFTSHLPRRGYVVVCPRCRGILDATVASRIGI